MAIGGGIVKRNERGDEEQMSRAAETQDSGRGQMPGQRQQAQASRQGSALADAVNRDGEAEKSSEKSETIQTNPSIMELANNSDFSVATIAKEANRIKEKGEGEVFISLH